MLNLRVTLSTAHTDWIDAFFDMDGVSCIERQLAKVSARTKDEGGVHEQIISEATKALRVIMNTDVSTDRLASEEECALMRSAASR